MNLVTTGNLAISVSTCIVGLCLLAPRTNMRAAVRYAVMLMRRPNVEPVLVESHDVEADSVVESQPVREAEPARELIDA